jgi:CheY-like chemotaxis protein
LPYATAAKLAYPERLSVAIVGDGGFSMLMAELVTAVANKLPVKIILLKNCRRGRLPKAPLIAIVDDDEFVRGSMRRLMRSLGYAVEVFPSAADFLASRRLDETACLIADIHMPAMTGVELYARLIESGYAIPTILVTAYPDDATQARALKDGVFCYLPKPFDDNDLLACVRMAVEAGEPSTGNS